MFRTYNFGITTWQDITEVRGRMTVGDLDAKGDPDLSTRKLWTPADLDVTLTGCSHAQTLTMQEYVAGAGHIACCAARNNWEDLVAFMSPCTVQAQVIAHPARVSRNRT